MSRRVMKLRALCGAALVLSVAGTWAHDGSHAKQPKQADHGAHHDAPAEQMPFGIAGKLKEQTRTVFVDMGDDMRFKPGHLEVHEGQTIRFIFRNKGKVMHEWVLGQDEELKRHAEEMRRHPDMQHDEPYMAHVPPGRSGEVVWRFNRVGTFKFACLIPGHFEAGMVGQVTVKPISAKR